MKHIFINPRNFCWILPKYLYKFGILGILYLQNFIFFSSLWYRSDWLNDSRAIATESNEYELWIFWDTQDSQIAVGMFFYFPMSEDF